MLASTTATLLAAARGGVHTDEFRRAHAVWLAAGAPNAPCPDSGTLGELLRARRLDLGLGQEDVVQAMRPIAVSQGQLSRWERSEGPLPDAGELAAWLDVLEGDPPLRAEALDRARHGRALRSRRTN